MTAPVPLGSALDALGDGHVRKLLRVSQQFNSTLDLEALLPKVLGLVLETLDAEGCALWFVEGDELHCRVAEGPVAGKLVGVRLPLGAGVAGDVIRSRTSALVAEPESDPRFLHQLDEATGFHTSSVLAVPLIAKDEVMGAIEVVNRRGGAGRFDANDQLFLEALADDAASAIRNARLFDGEKRASSLKALLEVSHEITSTFDLNRVLLSVVNLAGRAVRFDRCVLALWHDEKLRVRAISGEDAVDRKSVAVRELESFLHWAFERREALLIGDVQDPEDPLATQVRERFTPYLEASRARTLLVLPVRDSEGDLGSLLLEVSAPNALDDRGREAARLLANQSALAIRNAQLYAGVPFISWLEPLAEKRRKLMALPGPVWMAYTGIALAVLLVLGLIPLPLRVGAAEAQIRWAVQRPARAQIRGILETVAVREGEMVAAGGLVARLRNEELARQLRDTQAEREVAERQALAADSRGDREAAALARVHAAEAADAVELLEAESAGAAVVSPVRGIVLSPRLEERVGSFVEAGETVAWIGDSEWAELDAKLRQEDVGQVREGARVRARVSAHPAVTFEGRVTSVAPMAELVGGVPSYAVRAILDNRDQLLRPGMSANARVVVGLRPLAWHLFRRPWRWLRMRVWW